MMRVAALAAVAALSASCSGKMAVFRDPMAQAVAAQAAGPRLSLEIENVNLDTMGLYFAPNVVPAMSPQLATAASPPPLHTHVARPGCAVDLAVPAMTREWVGRQAGGGGEPPDWLVQRAAKGDAAALAALCLWEEVRR
jgi:hypothetical protein